MFDNIREKIEEKDLRGLDEYLDGVLLIVEKNDEDEIVARCGLGYGENCDDLPDITAENLYMVGFRGEQMWACKGCLEHKSPYENVEEEFEGKSKEELLEKLNSNLD